MTTKKIFYTSDSVRSLGSYCSYFPSVEYFESKVKSLGLLKDLNPINIYSRSGKSKKQTVFIYEINRTYFVQSYNTIVAAAVCTPSLLKRPVIIRFWDGASRSTSKHIGEALAEIVHMETYTPTGMHFQDFPTADIDVLLTMLAQTLGLETEPLQPLTY